MSRFEAELQLNCTVYLTMQEMLSKVEKHALLNDYHRMEHNFQAAQRLNDSLLVHLKKLEARCELLSSRFGQMQTGAETVRDSFVAEIGHFLTEAKQTKALRDKVALLESRLAKLSRYGEIEEE
ncbi:hypothetical protein EON64_20870, partial [archaeon]